MTCLESRLKRIISESVMQAIGEANSEDSGITLLAEIDACVMDDDFLFGDEEISEEEYFGMYYLGCGDTKLVIRNLLDYAKKTGQYIGRPCSKEFYDSVKARSEGEFESGRIEAIVEDDHNIGIYIFRK